MTRFRHTALLISLFLPPLLFAQGEIQPTVPRIEWTALPRKIVEKSPELKTGYLVVPERRYPTPTERTIRLPFIVISSRSASPRPDPVLYMAGGPGGSSMFRVSFFRHSSLLDDREVILLEQRGSRFAEPALMCPEIDSALRSGWGMNLNGDPDPQAVIVALTSAAHSLKEAGVDLAGYTTKESATDIAELRQLMGIASWNLYGVSYSTKLMLVVLRDHPQGVRAAILDSVLPLEANCDEETPANILGALDQMFDFCRQDERLRTRFSALRERFFSLLAEANRRPLEIVLKIHPDSKLLSLRLDGAGIMNCIYAGLEDASTIPRLPLIIDAVCRGETARLAPLAQDYLVSPQGTAWGMRLAVWCNEELPFEKLEKILNPAGMPPELARFIQPQVPLEALRLWPQNRPDARENEPVRSNIPVLIAAGEFDPDTPTKWAHQAASFLPNAQLIEFAGYSHVPCTDIPRQRGLYGNSWPTLPIRWTPGKPHHGLAFGSPGRKRSQAGSESGERSPLC